MIKAILCDLDGTLLDSNALHAQAWQQTLNHFGYQVSFSDTLHQIGKGGDQLLPVFVPEQDRQRLQDQIEKFRKDLFENQYFHQVKSFPHSRELLQAMKNAGFRIAIATSAGNSDLARLKKIAGIEDLVEKETSSDDAEVSKPAPDIFQAALDRLELDGSKAMALGDTPWDIQAARKAGLATVALTCGGWAEKDLQDAGAVDIYADPADLLKHFQKSAFMRDRPSSL